MSLDTASREALGRCLRELRQFAYPGVAQKDIAIRLGVSPPLLSQIETGKQEPGLGFIQKAARVYGVHPNVILGVIYLRQMPLEAAMPTRVTLEDVLTPTQRQEARDRLARLGYQ